MIHTQHDCSNTKTVLPTWNNNHAVNEGASQLHNHNVRVEEEKEIAAAEVATDEFEMIELVKSMMTMEEQQQEQQEQKSEQIQCNTDE